MQPDSIIPDLTNPQSLNRFGYVQNNPIRYSDPTGYRLVEDYGNGGCSTSGYCPGSSSPTYTPAPTGGSSNSRNKDKGRGDPVKRLGKDEEKIDNPILSLREQVCSSPPIMYPCMSNVTMWGFNFSGSMPSQYMTTGMEELYFWDEKTRAVYNYAGEGGTIVGGGVAATAYIGEVYNLVAPKDYIGPFGSSGVTVATPTGGITGSYFWDSTQPPFTPGTVKGYYIGFSPGAEASVWWSSTYYTLMDVFPK